MFVLQGNFEDIKDVIRSHNLTINRQYSGEQKPEQNDKTDV
jgi:hypothetical protein